MVIINVTGYIMRWLYFTVINAPDRHWLYFTFVHPNVNYNWLYNWLYNHKLFGPFLTNWETKKVFPQKAKYMMLGFMAFALILMIVTTGNWKAVAYSGTFMALGAMWGWRYPSTPEEYDRRKAAGERIGLFK